MTTRPSMNPRTIAGCFSTYVLPHLLFVDSFADRRKITITCCLAWNIGLFADAAQREKQIDMVWKMTEADNLGAPPGLEQGVKQDVQMLVDQKQDLFPRLKTLITKASLGRANGRDVLSIETDSGAEEVPLITSPRAAGLPYIIEVLRGIQENTAIQVDLMQQARRTPGALEDIMLTQMDRAYCAQRADLGPVST